MSNLVKLDLQPEIFPIEISPIDRALAALPHEQSAVTVLIHHLLAEVDQLKAQVAHLQAQRPNV